MRNLVYPCCRKWQDALLFKDWIILNFLHIYKPHFLYSFICWWKLGLFPFLAAMNNAAAYMRVQISLRSWFQFFGIYTQSEILVPYSGSIFNFLGNSIQFYIDATLFHIPPTRYRGYTFSNSSWTLSAKWNKLATEGQILYNFTYMRYLK